MCELSKTTVVENSHVRRCRPFWQKVAIALYRYGGTGETLARLKFVFNLAVGTILRYTRLVTAALREVSKKWVVWPDEKKRKQSSDFFESKYGLKGCIGIVDGTLIPISEPSDDGQDYFDRKRQYSTNLMLVVNEHAQIIYFVSGCPGSWHDSRVWGLAEPATATTEPARTHWYGPGERYIIGDLAFTSKEIMLVAFEGDKLSPVQLKFNECFAKARAIVEHCNGE